MSGYIIIHKKNQSTQTKETTEDLLTILRWSSEVDSISVSSVEVDEREDSNCVATQTDISFDNQLNQKKPVIKTEAFQNFDLVTLKQTKSSVFKDAAVFTAKTAVISGAVLGGVALAVPAIGFGAGGVVAGSLAAAFQSTFLGGSIAAGGIFATLQSLGAAGLAASAQAAVVAGSAAASAVHTAVSKKKDK